MIRLDDYPGMTPQDRERLKTHRIDTDEALSSLFLDDHRREYLALEISVDSEKLTDWCRHARRKRAASFGNMPADEYRTWVHDEISRRIYRNLIAILSLVGLAGVAIAATLVGSYNEMSVATQLAKANQTLNTELRGAVSDAKEQIDVVQDRMTARLDAFDREIEDEIKKGTLLAVVTALTEHTQLAEALDEKTSASIDRILVKPSTLRTVHQQAENAIKKMLSPENMEPLLEKHLTEDKIGKLVDDHLKKPNQTELIVKTAVDAIETNQGVDAILNSLTGQLETRLTAQNIDISQRRQALQMMAAFTKDDDKLRQTLKSIIRNSDPDVDELKYDALKYYRPTKNPDLDGPFLGEVLDDLSSEYIAHAGRRAYRIFFSQFPAEPHAAQISGWLRRHHQHRLATYLCDAIASMDGDEAVTQLVGLAIDPSNELVRSLGEDGLDQLRPDRLIDEGVRRKQVSRLWRHIEASLREELARLGPQKNKSPMFDAHAQQLFEAIRAKDRNRVQELEKQASQFGHERLTSLYIILVEEDRLDVAHEYFTSVLILQHYLNRDLAISRLASHDAFVKLLRIDDWQPLVVQELWTKPTTNPADRLVLDALLVNWTHRLDGFEDKQSESFRKHLSELRAKVMELKDCLYHEGSARAIEFAITYGTPEDKAAFLIQFDHLYHGDNYPKTEKLFQAETILFEALTQDPQTTTTLALGRQLLDKVAQNTERYQSLTYPLAIRLAQHARRLDGLGKPNEALIWHSRTIDLDPNNWRYVLARSLSHLNHGDMTESLADLEAASQKGAEISNDTALMFVMRGDEVLAKAAVEASLKPHTDELSKAAALENLSLYYVRTNQWRKAFEHTTLVKEKNPNLSWNWQIRAMAAYRLKLWNDERQAFSQWNEDGKEGDLGRLKRFIGQQIDQYLEDRKNSPPPPVDNSPETNDSGPGNDQQIVPASGDSLLIEGVG